jgi:membrane protein
LTFAAWRDDHIVRHGAALAFYSVLSLGPLLLLVLVAAARIWDVEGARARIVAQMTNFVGPEGAGSIQSILHSASGHRHGGLIATVFGFTTLMFSASGVFGELREAMNIIWKVPARQGRPFLRVLRGRFLPFMMTLVTAILFLSALIASTALVALAHVLNSALPVFASLMPWADFSVSLILTALLFGLIFKTVPDTRVPWASIWPGAILSATLFVIGKTLIGFYLGHTGIVSSYGAAGSVIVILVWVYYSAQILFFGAEFASAYDRARRAQK